MSLKQWRAPRTWSLPCLLTNSCTCSRELAECKCSVLYSRLPAQFFSLPPDAQANRGAMTGHAVIAEKSLRNVLLCMGELPFSPREAHDRAGRHRGQEP